MVGLQSKDPLLGGHPSAGSLAGFPWASVLKQFQPALHADSGVPRLPVGRRNNDPLGTGVPGRKGKLASHRSGSSELGENPNDSSYQLDVDEQRHSGTTAGGGTRPTHFEKHGTALMLVAASPRADAPGSADHVLQMQQELRAEGYDTEVVEHLPALKAYLRSADALPDVVLISTMLNGVSTLQTSAKMCQTLRRTKVISLSNHAKFPPAEALRMGVHDAVALEDLEEVLARVEVQLAHGASNHGTRDFMSPMVVPMQKPHVPYHHSHAQNTHKHTGMGNGVGMQLDSTDSAFHHGGWRPGRSGASASASVCSGRSNGKSLPPLAEEPLMLEAPIECDSATDLAEEEVALPNGFRTALEALRDTTDKHGLPAVDERTPNRVDGSTRPRALLAKECDDMEGRGGSPHPFRAEDAFKLIAGMEARISEAMSAISRLKAAVRHHAEKAP